MNNRDDLAMRVEQVREDYGDELFDTVLDEADRRAQEREQWIRQSQFTTNKQVLSDMLSRQGINFEQVNHDPAFHDWLKVYDPQTGVQRQARLTQSFESGDFNTVSSMFVGYVNGSGQQPSNSQTAQSFGQQNNMSHQELAQKHQQLLRLRSKASSRNDDAAYDDLTKQMDEVTRMMMQ